MPKPGEETIFQDESIPPPSISLPEKRLFAAILSRAIVDVSGSSSLDPLIIEHAHEWIFGEYLPEIELSFDWVCEQLDLSPQALRAAIKLKLPSPPVATAI